MEAIAKGKYLRGSPQKARLVIDLIRGRKVQEALAILRVTNKRAAKPVEKILLSAVANAKEKNATADSDSFIVEKAVVDTGPTKWRRRVRPAPMGRAYRQQKRFKHISITIKSKDIEEG
ncbi:MAG TPA: 50S ribosomal protein L22 [Acidobacteriota bacterium]|nr:50S ribosomal protein L22 [Acidobacteriota bacterium]